MSRPQQFYTPREVADVMRVDVRTVAAWARQGRITSMRTIGGHHRYPRAEIDRILTGADPAQTDTPAPEEDATSSGRLAGSG